ncbi:MAG TPA: hypothetical protein VMC62_04565 [Longilinea sp.]|nr:hypothetical protein [Longilinea sp.]
MNHPHLTFFCELDPGPLKKLFADSNLVDQLKALNASISLGIRDFSPERVEIVKTLHAAGIPVTAWLLLPREQGYWFNLDNAPHAVRRYGEFRNWTAKNKLNWAAIGIDIEPDIQVMDVLSKDPTQVSKLLLPKLFDSQRIKKAESEYTALITQMHLNGYIVESYQFPLIADERKAHSDLIRKVCGILDLGVDREVFMLYSSFAPALGAGMITSYAPDTHAIALGSTGGGVEIEGQGELAAMDWPALKRDLLLASHSTDNLYIFSLEGCLRQGYLEKLAHINWEETEAVPLQQTRNMGLFRMALQSVAWIASHPLWVIAGILSLNWLFHKRK